MDRKKIFVIGPIIPFTGGIAHSNTVLCNNLSKNNDVTAISYSMMFPKILYPGKAQKSGKKIKTKFKQKFILNTLNPLSWIKIVNMVKKEKPEWVVFEWWHTYFFPSYYFITFFSKIFTKTKFKIICHNVLPHEEGLAMKLIHKPFTKILLKKVDDITALSKSELRVAKKLAQETKTTFILENSYASLLSNKKVSKSVARKKLGIKNEKVILSFGAVRKYKGVEDLVEAISLLPKKEDYMLVVAGAFWGGVEKYQVLAKEFGVEKNIKFIDKYIPDEEIPILFGAADLLVLSHRSATQSAIPQLAYVYSTPIIATNVAGNAPFVEEGRNGFIIPPKNPKEMSKAINKFFSKDFTKKFILGNKEVAKKFEWNKEKEKIFFGEN
jgi:glycosyltransferase involved in cell wall biosynthesis